MCIICTIVTMRVQFKENKMKTYSLYHEDFIETAIEAPNWRVALDEYALECGFNGHNDMCQQLGWYESEIQLEEI